MPANSIPLFLDQGTSFSANIAVSNTTTGNINIDLSDYSSRAKFKKYYTSSNSFSFNTSINVNNAVVTLSMNAASTANVPFGRYLYDVEVYSANSKQELIEEFADILEVMTVWCQLQGSTLEDVMVVQRQKFEKRGGFQGRKFITTVQHLEGSSGEKYCLADPKKYPEIKE